MRTHCVLCSLFFTILDMDECCNVSIFSIRVGGFWLFFFLVFFRFVYFPHFISLHFLHFVSRWHCPMFFPFHSHSLWCDEGKSIYKIALTMWVAVQINSNQLNFKSIYSTCNTILWNSNSCIAQSFESAKKVLFFNFSLHYLWNV